MADFDYNIVKNPEIFFENRLPAHSDHEFYTTEPARTGEMSDCKVLLNGIWRFSYSNTYTEAVKGFEKEDYSVDSWDRIKVPGHIQLAGYGVPQYCNTQYPWDGTEDIEPGEIPAKFNPTATYVRFFDLPEKMRGHEVHISFQGVESGFALWLNGTYIGYSEDSFTPSEFDLTPYLRDKDNRLAVQAFRFTSGSWCEDQDFFRFTGIFRDVFLIMLPKVHVDDMKVRTVLDSRYKNAVLKLDLHANSVASVKVQLLDDEDRVVAVETKECEPAMGSTKNKGADKSSGLTVGEEFADAKAWTKGTTASLKIPVNEPSHWSAEMPYLYTLKIEVFDGNSSRTETILEKVGFRRFEMIDNMMHLNGKRIVFKGVNRHEFSAESGRVLDPEITKLDLITMKQNNINAVRTCHYPDQTILYRLCDELGLYVIDETNLETHGVWDMVARGQKDLEFALPGNRPEWQMMILDRANSMYQRDKNHACILIWSCGNESFGGRDIYEMSRFFHRIDDARLVHYEGCARDRRFNETTDMESTMYATVDEIKAYLADHRERPYISCEFAHAMGNACGALLKYTQLTEEDPLYQGGFIWDYIDQSLTLTDRYGAAFQGYGGDFGDRPNDGSFCGNGICYPDRTPSPKMQEVKNDYSNIEITFEGDQVTIYNKNLFINTDIYRCVLTLSKNGEIIDEKIGQYTVKPLGKMTCELPLELPEDDGEYIVTVSFRTKNDTLWAKAGHEVAWGQNVIVKGNVSYTEESHDGSGMTVTRGALNVGIAGNSFRALFSTLHGGLVSYVYGGKEMVAAIPRPNFWRPMTENDIGNLLPFRAGQWKAASAYVSTKYEHGRNATDYVIKEEEDRVTIIFTYHLATKPAKDCLVTYIVTADGTIDTTLEMDASSDVGELPAFGMLFKMSADFDQLRWYGKGKDETYLDRDHAKIGIYANEVKDNVAKYLRPQECGNKMDVRWAEVTDSQGHGLQFICNNHQFSALPYSPDEMDSAQHPNELPPMLYTYIRIGEQMGVGGDDAWGALVHPEYLLDNSKPMSVHFKFKGL